MKQLTILSALLLAVSFALAQDATELDMEHSVDSALVTPHTDWATPYALGKTRVLFFVGQYGTVPREVIELKERFDLDPQMVFWATIIDTPNEHWHGDEAGIRRMTRLLTQKWDAFVFMGRATLDKLPAEQQYTLLKAVADGAGLVLVSGDDPRVLKDKNKLPEQPPFLSDVTGATAFTVKQGRGVRLPTPAAIPYDPAWQVTYDEWDMRFGKAVLWAAGKEPKLTLKLSMPATTVDRLQASENPLKVAVEGSELTSDLDVKVSLRRDDGWSKPFPAASGFKPTGLRAGNYYWDVIARYGKNVATFGSLPFTIISNRKVDSLTLDPDWAEIGDKIAGKAMLVGQPGANEQLLLSLIDRRSRVIAAQTLPAAPEQSFSFTAQPWYPMLLQVRATLMQGDQEVASAWQYARVVKRNRGQFNFVMWDLPGGNLGPVGDESLARSGVTIHLSGGAPPAQSAAYDLAWIPYTTHIGKQCDPACWADEAGVQAYVDGIVDKQVPARRHGAFVYSLGDEIIVRGSCVKPTCLDNYRKYLQEQYQTVAALNASWGTTYASFAEVQLSQPEDNNEAEALRAGNFPRWYDRQAYQSWNFCQLCERFGKAFRALDPQSKCGFEGAGTFADGDDLDGFVRSNGWWSPYPGTADEVLRSIAPRDFPHSNWMGYTRDADTLLEKYWRMVTRGCDSVFWWRWDGVGRFHGFLMENLDPYPANRELLKDTQIARDGLGDLLLHSDMQDDGIGMLYSQPSAYAAKVQTAPSFGSYESSHAAFHGALRDLGYGFRYFTDRQMRLGEVDLSKFKVIILPLTQAMSAQDAEMFRQYVSKGGTLIADVRPAIYNEHVKPLAAGQLDDVFGIKRTGFDNAAVADATLKVPAAGNKLEPLDLTKVRVDMGVERATASAAGAAGNAPLFLENNFGQGVALLLNMSMSTYPALSSESTPDLAAKPISDLIGRGGVRPALGLTNAQGERLRNVETERWMNGPVQVLSVFRHQGQPEPATLTLPAAIYAYDLKNHKDLGKQQAFNFTITPYRAQFFALSPQPLKPVELKPAPSVAPGGLQRVTVTATLPAGQQAVRVQVKLPDGSSADWIDRVVVADRKGATVDVPVAFNDPKGTWTVSATDLYTNKTTSTQFSVK